MRLGRLAVVGLLACGAAAAEVPDRAPAAAPLPVETAIDILTFADFSPVDLSPDGTRVANTIKDARRVVTDADPQYHAYSRSGASMFGVGCDVWVTDVATGQSRNVTQGHGSSWYPVWSPDGRFLAFYSDRDGTAKPWLWEAATGKMRALLSSRIARPIGGETIAWTADSRSVIVHVLPAGMTIAQAAALFGAEKDAAPRTAGGPTARVFRGGKETEKAAGWSSDWLVGDLVAVDVAGGAERTLAKGFKPLGTALSPDGSRLLFASMKPPAKGSAYQQLFDLVVVDLRGGAPRVVAEDVPASTGREWTWTPDGRSIVYMTGNADEDVKSSQIYAVAADGGTPPRLLSTGEHPAFTGYAAQPLLDASGAQVFAVSEGALWAASLGAGGLRRVAEFPGKQTRGILGWGGLAGRAWSPDGTGKTVAVVVRDRESKRISAVKVDVASGAATSLFDEERVLSDPLGYGVDVSRDGKRIVYLTEDATHPEDLWVAGPDLSDRRRLTRLSPGFDDYLMGAVRVLEWTALDGSTMRGALLLPSDYREGQRYPAIVYPYGGSDLSNRRYTFGLSARGTENMQLFATRGYAVFMPDTKTRVGTPMRDIADSVLAGVAKLIDSGVADPARLGVMGHSYGGYSVMSLVVQTNIFHAAVARAGVYDLAGNYGDMFADGSALNVQWAEGGQGRMGGTPWDQRARYVENSPFFYLDRVTTPVLLIHGAEDLRVPVHNADETFVALRRLGKEVEYARYDGEDHSELYWSHPNQIDYCRRVIAWFDAHLKAPSTTVALPEAK
ncbi:MAG TPA: prolyl oligopeptidase family serine peptidase [Thermoanaerobaculia bacterium]|jgi:dipeptidyl aminopeptidase/acylaminoacyl peptidase|nr:prolyl oligopeptidase family serine peptidase [Thermoanaerobaculia bacterium]